MARKSRLSPRARRTAQVMSLPAPTGGINARDSLALMQINQAVELTNLFPLQYGVRVRKGWRQFQTDHVGDVETLMVHAGLDGVQTMFAAANGAFYDATTAGTLPAAAASGFTSNRWQHTNMTNTFGTFTCAVNGVDTPQYYNGTAWAAMTITADAVLYPSFAATDFINIALAHRRLWFVEQGSGSAWYLPVDQISGQAERFNVGEVFPRGGYLQAIGTWSVDSGAGIDDHTVFVSSEGDVALYSGYDPTDVTNFTLVGVYQLGRTLGRRCLAQRGGDLLILTEGGLIPMTSVLAQGKEGELAIPLTDMIRQKFSDDVALYHDNFGWQAILVRRAQMLLLNVPQTAEQQYAMNDVTGAWCQFEGYAAKCWAVLNGEPYFGAAGYVGQAWYGDYDNYDADLLTGSDVDSSAIQAFNYFGRQAMQKRWTMVRPTFNAVTAPPTSVDMAVDFDLSTTISAPAGIASTANEATWDSSLWDDADAIWRGALQSIRRWFSLGRLGYAGALMLRLATHDETVWVATDFVYEPGGIL